MRSPKQIEASRANGALSKGPITPQGKAISSRNSLRDGLLARTVVLEAESTERFLALLEGYLLEFQPVTATEVSLVEALAVAKWRQLRVWGVQKSAIDRDMALQDPATGPASVRAGFALRGSPESSCAPDLLLRYEHAYAREFARIHARLLDLKSRGKNTPRIPHVPTFPSGQTFKETEDEPSAEGPTGKILSTQRTQEQIENKTPEIRKTCK